MTDNQPSYTAARGIYQLTPTMPHALGRHAASNGRGHEHVDCAGWGPDYMRCTCPGSRPEMDSRCCAPRLFPGDMCGACAEHCGNVPPKPPFHGGAA